MASIYFSDFFITFICFLSICCLIYLKERIVDLWMKVKQLTSIPSKKEDELTINNLNNSNNLTKFQARLLLITCAMMYGSNFVGTKILQETLAPSMITTLRFFIGSLFFIEPVFKFQGDLAVIKGGIELGVWTALGFLVQTITLQFTSANKNAFLCALSVVMIPIFESFYLCCPTKFCRLCSSNSSSSSSSLSLSSSSSSTTSSSSLHQGNSNNHNNLHIVIIPALLSLCGIASLEYGGLEPPSLIDAVVLLAPVCFAMGFWRTEYIASQHPQETSVITGCLLITTTIICFMYSLLSQEFPLTIIDLKLAYSSIFLDWKVLGGLLYAGIFMTAWSSYVEQSSLKVLTAAEATVIYSLEPLFAAVFSSIFLHEYFGYNSFFGAVCIVLACLWNVLIVPSLSIYLPISFSPKNLLNSPSKCVV